MPPLMRRRGDLIEHKKLGYSRWSVYIGDGEVVEVDNKNNHQIIRRKRKFEISVSWVNNEFDERVKPLKNAVIVQRAISQVGTYWKDTHPLAIINNISEHFAKWCRYGTDVCNQSPHLSFHDNHASVGLGKVETGLLSVKLPNAYTTAQNNSVSTNFKVGAELVGGEALGAIKWSAQAAADAGIDHGNGKHAINFGVDGPQAQIGPLEAKCGIRADTGVNCNRDGLGFTILGTEPYPQNFSLPFPIIKYLIDHSTPTVWKKLIKTCKYFYPKKSVYPVHQIKAVTGYKWNADGEVFDPEKFTPKIWLYDSVMIYDFVFGYSTFISTLIPIVAVNDIRNIDIFCQKFSWKEYQYLTSSPKFERLHLFECIVTYSDDSFVTFDKLLENLSSLKYFKMICRENSEMFEPDTVKKMVPILSSFKTDPLILFHNLPETCNFSDFVDFVMKNETVNVGVSFSTSGSKEKSENLMNAILANPPKRIPFIDLLYNHQGQYEEYQKLYQSQAKSS